MGTYNDPRTEQLFKLSEMGTCINGNISMEMHNDPRIE